jgi:hypothetical protein
MSFLAAMWTAVLSAQQPEPAPPAKPDRRAQVLQQLLVRLDTEQVADHEAAVERVVNLGPAMIEPLQRRLRDRRHHGDSPAVQRGILLALGLHGRAAAASWRHVRELLREDDLPTAQTALWTLGAMVPFLTVDERLAIRDDLKRLPAAIGGHTLAGVLEAMASIDVEHEPANLRGWLQHAGIHTLASCRWITAKIAAGQPIDDRAALTETIEGKLAAATSRDELGWGDYGHQRLLAPDLAETLLALAARPLDDRTARALLDHWQVAQRRRGLAWLRDGGAGLPAPERTDVVARLWDGEPTLAASAAAVLADWGQAGWVGLGALRLLQRTHAEEVVRSACERAAVALVASVESMPAPDRTLLRTIDAALRGEPLTTAELAALPKASARARQLGTDVLSMAAWCPAPHLDAVLQALAAAGEPPRAAFWAMLGWIMRKDPAVVDLGLAWLARQPGTAWPEVRLQGDPLDEFWPMFCCELAVPASRPTAVEATVFILTAGADPAQLLTDLLQPNHRQVARALSQLLAERPGTLRPETAALQRLVAADRPGPINFREFDREEPVACDLGPPLRVLAAMALAELGEAVPGDEALVELVHHHCACRPTELADRMPEWRRSGELLRRLDALEADCRRRLGVPAHLRWPQLAAH